MPNALEDLKVHLATIVDLRTAAAVLAWDQETYMPPGGAENRANQLGTLNRIAHEMFTSPQTGELLAAAASDLLGFDADSDEAALVAMTRRDYDRARKLPADFVAERARARSLSTQVWQQARTENNFAAFRPYLARMFDFARRTADYLGYQAHPYDALLDQYEPDMTSAEVAGLFTRLREATVPLVSAIVERGQPVEAGFLAAEYDEDRQREFGLAVAEAFGYDLRRGRLDRSAHPFSSGFGRDDVRITTRYNRRFLPTALFGIFHEAGHALYDQGVSPSLERTPIGGGASLGFHESQSRLWENLVGRSRPFWRYYFPRLRKVFPKALRGVDAEGFYRAVNRVYSSLIRVEADEVTYNLHIILRFELEKQVLEGALRVDDLPEAWNAKMKEYLGLVVPTDASGVLQDIHWSSGSIGYFPTYTLGNIISVQLFEAARRAHPDLWEQIGRGEFGTLLGWLREHVHRHGRKFLPQDLLRRATGADLTPEPYVAYLWAKYGDIYGVAAPVAVE